MFRTLDFGPGEQSIAYTGPDQAMPPDAGVVRWVDLQAPTDAELELLRQRFKFHPLAIEDCSHLDQRPKLDEFNDHLFVVTQGLACSADRLHQLDLYELHAFVGHGYLVTVHSGAMPAIDQIWERCNHSPTPLSRGADFVYYLLADALVDLGFPILDSVSAELSEIEDRMLHSPKKRDLERIFELRRHLAAMRKVMSPQRETMIFLSRREAAQISERTALYLRDVVDHLTRLTESIEMSREQLNSSVEAYVSATSMRTNEVMKSLTLLSAVFLPLTFVVGFFGQNFQTLPGLAHWTESPSLALAVVAFCAVTPPAMFAWFRAKDWL